MYESASLELHRIDFAAPSRVRHHIRAGIDDAHVGLELIRQVGIVAVGNSSDGLAEHQQLRTEYFIVLLNGQDGVVPDLRPYRPAPTSRYEAKPNRFCPNVRKTYPKIQASRYQPFPSHAGNGWA